MIETDQINFITNLGRKKFGEKFELASHWDIESVQKIAKHFFEYKIENRKLKIPEKGLFICSNLEDEAIILNHLLDFRIKQLYIETEDESYYNRVPSDLKISPNTVSARLLSMEILEMKPLEIMRKYSSINILSIVDFGRDTLTKLPNYNEFDFVPEFLNKRYLDHRFRNANTILYVYTNCSPAELKKRYSKETFFHLKSLTDEIFLSDPGEEPTSKS